MRTPCPGSTRPAPTSTTRCSGARLRECCRALLDLEDTTAVAVLGSVDAMKLRSSMTLFARADPDERCCVEVLERFFDGEPDPATDALLR